MTEAKNPCGQLSAPNGVWYVAAGRLCFGSTVEDLQESAPPFSLNDSLPPPPLLTWIKNSNYRKL